MKKANIEKVYRVSLFLFLSILGCVPELLAAGPVLTEEQQNVKINSIIQDPAQYEGREVIIEAKFAGWMHVEAMDKIDMSVCNKGPCLTRSDIQIYDDTACIYVTDAEIFNKEGKEIFLDPANKQDAGQDIIVKGKVAIAKDGRPYIQK